MACDCSTTRDQEPKAESIPPLGCGNADCIVNSENLRKMFPDLRVRPCPEPNPAEKDKHDAWLREYNQWGALKCPCGRGYFCRAHGSWISGEEVGSGVAATSDEQKHGSCPAHHYGDYIGVTSYVGERDASVASSHLT